MENSDPFASSTAPLTWHDFLERMRQPSAADFVKAIKSFIVSFSNNAPDPERDSAAVQEFLANMEMAFRAHPLWAGCSEEELESAGELAQKELQKINMYKAPRDKLVCILNCCKVINNLLLNASIASNEDPPGADEFLPVLIYVTLKANPPQLHSNLLYILRYRRQSRMVAEAAYFFTNMLSAESFISSINAESLSMDEREFEMNMESARALLSGLSSDLDGVLKEPQQKSLYSKKEKDPSIGSDLSLLSSEATSGAKLEPHAKDQLITKVPSISDLENKGAAMLLKEDQVSLAFREYPYLYANVGDLTVNDVEDLLNHYKQLVFKHVCLSKGLGVPAPPLPLSISQTQGQKHAETMKDSVDTRAAEVKDNTLKDIGSTNDVSNQVSLFEVETSESKLPQEEAVEPQ
ncbi:hypothetical protein PVL29_023339 [Vitis rotundifolia]|uniref:VPS9 domain-containing protein n=1 Tax=Vitis rotundifolia TaxID=103349 RepID=A0AA39D868_VITRO|nr:hypothetical protein PVL29_023339 [Vitis rotundifolia]